MIEKKFNPRFLKIRIEKFIKEIEVRLNSTLGSRQKIDAHVEFKPFSHKLIDTQTIEFSDDPHFAVRPQTLELIDLRKNSSEEMILDVVREDWFEINFKINCL